MMGRRGCAHEATQPATAPGPGNHGSARLDEGEARMTPFQVEVERSVLYNVGVERVLFKLLGVADLGLRFYVASAAAVAAASAVATAEDFPHGTAPPPPPHADAGR